MPRARSTIAHFVAGDRRIWVVCKMLPSQCPQCSNSVLDFCTCSSIVVVLVVILLVVDYCWGIYCVEAVECSTMYIVGDLLPSVVTCQRLVPVNATSSMTRPSAHVSTSDVAAERLPH